MKRLLALMLTILMCLSFTACKNGSSSKNATALSEEQLEQEIRVLMERNLDCYFLFYVSPINHTTQQNSDGYYGTDEAFMSDYATLSDMVNATYSAQTAKKLLSHPLEETPLYKNVDGKIFTKPDVIEPVEYNLSWEDYTVEFSEITDEKCTFTLKTTDFDNKEYETNGSAISVDGTWLLEDIIY